MKKIIDILPDIYSNFLPDFFQNEIPEESFATCNNCSMVCSSGIPNNHKQFLKTTKCCTYYPKIPNFLVGSIIDNEIGSIGHSRIISIINKNIGVSPRGISAPNMYELVYSSSKSNFFGKSEAMRCPLYIEESGNCSIWKHRNNTCSTWFCKYVRNKNGEAFWNALREYLLLSEELLVMHVLNEEGYEELLLTEIDYKVSIEELENLNMSDENIKNIWKHNYQNSDSFFRKSYNIVKSLNQLGFLNIVGIKGKIQLKKLEYLYRLMMSTPSKLVLSPNSGFYIKQHERIIENYKVRIDNINIEFSLPKIVFELFNGSNTNDEIIEELKTIHSVEIDIDLISTLYSYNILLDHEFVKNLDNRKFTS